MDTNHKYWLIKITYELEQNDNLFAEFEISRNETYGYDRYKLENINIKSLLSLIKNVMNTKYENKKYFITTRSKDDGLHYYIVLSIIQD